MNKNKIKSILKKKIKIENIYVHENNKHYDLIIISTCFKSLNMVKRHQLIYNALIKLIQNNTIHAISMKTYTPEEWLIKN